MRAFVRGLAAALALVVVTPAAARPERARAIERIADEHRREGRLEQALVSYRDAWLAHPAPRYLYRLGQCEWQRERIGRALFFFDAYLQLKAVPPFKKQVDKRVKQARERLAADRATRGSDRVALLPLDGLPSEEAEGLTARLHGALVDAGLPLRGLDQTYADLHLASLVGVECAAGDQACQRRLLPLLEADVLVTAQPEDKQLKLARVGVAPTRAKPAPIRIEELEAGVRAWAGQPVEKSSNK
jgi:hypothetical protein